LKHIKLIKVNEAKRGKKCISKRKFSWTLILREKFVTKENPWLKEVNRKILYNPLKNKIKLRKKIVEKWYDNIEKIIRSSERKLKEGGQPILKILKENHQKERIGDIRTEPFSINRLRLFNRSYAKFNI
jgi:hypothetical protein